MQIQITLRNFTKQLTPDFIVKEYFHELEDARRNAVIERLKSRKVKKHAMTSEREAFKKS